MEIKINSTRDCKRVRLRKILQEIDRDCETDLEKRELIRELVRSSFRGRVGPIVKLNICKIIHIKEDIDLAHILTIQ